MKYNELKEMEVKDWDGKPFEAYYTDDPDRIVDGATTGILGYVEGKWFSGARWNHVYPVEWNKEKVDDAKPERMTNRQIAMWLAKGNGQIMYLSHTDLSVETTACVQTSHSYSLLNEFFECNDRIRVRRWDSEDWIEPTIDLLEGC